MSALSVTPANVLKGASASTNQGIAGATITAGQPIYLDSATSTVKLADADASTTTATVIGIALNGASAGQPISWVTGDGDFTPGATLVSGESYYLGSTAGAINPVGDLATGWYPVLLFIAKSTTKAVMQIVVQNTATHA